ncbi:MAG: two-component regulator propeller domain-containing protein [Reichenbachiella sp.]|uniref:ligand-binding sensor domain-containing protein n=1 Tax=Reichenbachiella sp. TaxID=2184521 RepID=UPI003297EA1A
MRLICVVFGLLLVIAPHVSVATQIDTLQINYLGQEEGIKQLNVQKIVQDDLDYLWFSTEDGLHRFNGLQLKVFTSNPLDSLSIPDDHNRGLLIVDDTLWVASNSKGIFALDLKTELFVTPFDELSNAISYQVFSLDDTHLLFSLSDVFYVLDRKSRDLTQIQLPRNKSENYVKDVLPLGDNNYMIATLSSGLLTFDLSELKITKQTKLGDFSHNALVIHQDQLFVGTDEGFFSLNVQGLDQKQQISHQLINCIYVDIGNEILLGTKDGLSTYNLKHETYIQQVFKDQSGHVYYPVEIEAIYGDNKGNFWFGTAGEGLHHFNRYQKKFKTISLSVPEYSKDTKLSTFQLLPGKDSILWLGTSFNVLKYNLRNGEVKHYTEFPESLIYTLKKDSNGDIWCGGFDGTGLLKYNENSDQFERATINNSENDKTVIEIQPLSKSRLLYATWSSGIFIYDLETQETEEFLIDGIQINRARISFVDSKKNLWLGTDQGAFMIEQMGDGSVHRFESEGLDSMVITSNRIFGINEDSKGNIWLGTSTGLTKISPDSHRTKRYYAQEGFPNDFVYGVLVDEMDHVWVSTNQGISKLNPTTEVFLSYSQKDGLQNDEFNGKAAYQDDNGYFYFGGVEGINVFDPQNINANPYQPKVHLESVEVFNQPLDVNGLYTDTYTFKSEEKVLSFQFATTNFLNPKKVNYSFYMEGFDDNWRPATKSQSTTYTNLPPGQYKFRIRATNDNGTWGTHERAVDVIIVPPWYATWWFRITAALLIGLFITLFVLYKYHSLKRNKAMLEKVVMERTNELSEALELSNAQKDSIKFLMRELKHRVKNNLQIISSLLSLQAVQLKDDQAVESLNSAKNRISNISYLENMMDSENEHIQVDVFTRGICENVIRLISADEIQTFTVEYDLKPAKVVNFNITIYGLIINELLTNTSKYAFSECDEKNVLHISCEAKQNRLELIISDNGKGYNPEEIKNTSLGLDLVKDMVRQLNGTITIENKEGIRNVITIPIENE